MKALWQFPVILLAWAGQPGQILEAQLHDAAQANDYNAAESLIARGADINARDDSGQTPLMYAVENHALEAAALLLEKGAEIDNSLLMLAAGRYSYRIIPLLIAAGLDVNARTPSGYTPLHAATDYVIRPQAVQSASSQLHKTARVLLDHGADANATSKYGQTPLHHAAHSKIPDTIRLLVNHGASVAARDIVGWTPLHYALTIGGDDTSDDTRRTALTLVERGAPVDAETTVAGWRSLHLAVWHNDPTIVRTLIERGADINARMMPGGVTPLHLALRQPGEIADMAETAGWSQARLEERLKAAGEVVAVLRSVGAFDRVDEAAFPRFISDGWFRDDWWVYNKRRGYPEPYSSMFYFSSGRYSIQGSFTAKGAVEHLISEPFGGISFGHYGNILGILDKEGRMQLQWIADNSIKEKGLCFDAVSGLDHVRLLLAPSGTAHQPYNVYLYYDPDSGLLVEAFNDYWFGHRTAEPGHNGACNWRQAKEAVAKFKEVFPALQVGEVVTIDKGTSFVMPARAIERVTAESSLASLRVLPSDVAEVSSSLESPRWEIVKASRGIITPYGGYPMMSSLLVRDKEQDNWRSISDCAHIDIRELRDNTLLFDVRPNCDIDEFYTRVKLDLATMQASATWPSDCESIDNCRLDFSAKGNP